jgi:hypothetical protein
MAKCKKIIDELELGEVISNEIIEDGGNYYEMIKYNKQTPAGIQFTKMTYLQSETVKIEN